jgi:hypothetical protein
MMTMILLFVGIGLAYSSGNVPGEVVKPAASCNGYEYKNNSTDAQNHSCSDNISCPINQKCRTNGTGTFVGHNIENNTWACTCQNNTTCYLNNCTFNNCTCQELGAKNNSSSISCTRIGPCPLNLSSNQMTSAKEKKGRVFTLTLNCPRCT